MKNKIVTKDTTKVFDWNKAAQIIKDRNVYSAAAGLDEDWGCTGGSIWYDGKPVAENNTYTFLASSWATPVLVLYSEEDAEYIECWKYAVETPEWTAKTYWPESALAIISEA